MRYCKSKCSKRQEVNSAPRFKSCLSHNTPLLISCHISPRELTASDVGLSKGLFEVKVKHELRSCNREHRRCNQQAGARITPQLFSAVGKSNLA